MSASINYASTPKVGAATLTTGDASRTAPTVAPTVLTPGGSGSQVERITATPLATTTATTLRIFRHDGTTHHLYTEIQIPAQTITGPVAVIPITLEAVNYPNLFPILVPAGWTLRASLNDTQTGIKVQADAGDF
jgi:hypothetical protein